MLGDSNSLTSKIHRFLYQHKVKRKKCLKNLYQQQIYNGTEMEHDSNTLTSKNTKDFTV